MAKRKRTHLPQLSADRLKLLSNAIDKHPLLSKAGKRAVKQSLTAAASGNAETPDVIIASLPKARRETVMAHTVEMMAFSQGITARGKDKLMAMSAEEWDNLVNSSTDVL